MAKKAKKTEKAARKVNERAIEIIRKYESLKLEAYLCPAGVWTIGWGHTGPEVKEGMKITKTEAEKLFQEDIASAARSVESLVTVKTSDNQFSELVSFVFNIGHGHFANSTLLKKINTCERCENEFDRWIRCKGEILPGLIKRRKEERSLFESR